MTNSNSCLMNKDSFASSGLWSEALLVSHWAIQQMVITWTHDLRMVEK